MKIYHNPRCSKSRQTLQRIRDRGIEPEVIEYLKNPPTTDELDQILRLLNLEPQQLLRMKEPEAKAIVAEHLDRNTLIERMVAQPKCIERPIVVSGTRAAIGRPPENVDPLFES